MRRSDGYFRKIKPGNQSWQREKGSQEAGEKAILTVIVRNDKDLDLGIDGTKEARRAHTFWQLNFTGNNHTGALL